jgi:hypothetical protein
VRSVLASTSTASPAVLVNEIFGMLKTFYSAA